MALTTKVTRVVSIGDPDPIQDQIMTALSTQQEFQLVETIHSLENLAREIRLTEPDIILLDHQIEKQSTIDIIDDVSLQFPDAAVVAILPASDPILAQKATLAGARAFVIRPFTQINLLTTLRRVRDLEDRRRKAHPVAREAVTAAQPLHTLVVFGPRGGVGTSTIAANLAISLYEATAQRILLFEGKLFFGHLDVMLNIRSSNTLADLVPHANHLDENLVSEVTIQHSSGPRLMLAPRNLQVSQGIRPDDLYNIVASVQKFYDMVVIDAGSSINDNTVTLMDSADKIIMVTTPDLASLRDISTFIQTTRSLDYPSEKLMLIMNRAGMPGGVKSSDIEAVLHMPIFAKIPNDEGNVLRSINRGIPLVERYPHSPASQAIRQLAKTLVDMGEKNVREASPRPAPEKSLSKSAVPTNS